MICKDLTILEGPDGGGKSTLAEKYKGARVVHFGPMLEVTDHLPRMYVEAMLPALLGYQDVVMDRSWLSEPIYAEAMRNGDERLTFIDYRMLERLAARCGTAVVKCLPRLKTCLKTYQSRKEEEYLDELEQLAKVHDGYVNMKTDLPCFVYDYEESPYPPRLHRTSAHYAGSNTSGNLFGDILFFIPKPETHASRDTLAQFPGVRFSDSPEDTIPDSLTVDLMAADIPEDRVMFAWDTTDHATLRTVDEWRHCSVRFDGQPKRVICVDDVNIDKDAFLDCNVYNVDGEFSVLELLKEIS